MEKFTKKWLEASMQRAWSAIEDVESVLTPGTDPQLPMLASGCASSPKL